jgi:signal transduction histidine kinase
MSWTKTALQQKMKIYYLLRFTGSHTGIDGQGLDLSLVKTLVETSGGTIAVTTKICGTEVTIVL